MAGKAGNCFDAGGMEGSGFLISGMGGVPLTVEFLAPGGNGIGFELYLEGTEGNDARVASSKEGWLVMAPTCGEDVVLDRFGFSEYESG